MVYAYTRGGGCGENIFSESYSSLRSHGRDLSASSLCSTFHVKLKG
jgi:hypothetical protein